jgi:frataxin-like iron-binding protein CyaY
MKKQIVLSTAAVIGSIGAMAQHAINSAGINVAKNNIAHEVSIGEMTLVHTATAKGIIATQGLLQPMWLIEPINTVANEEATITVFPNPTQDILNISLPPNVQLGKVQIFDIGGKLIYNSNEPVLQLHVASYASGQYLLHVSYTPLHTTQFTKQIFKINKQ